MAELVKQRYAKALFEVAIELKREDDFLMQLNGLDRVLKENPGLLKILKAPMVSKDEKKTLIDEIFANKISNESINFLKVLVDKKRFESFHQIVATYKELLNESRNIKEVTAVTAVALSEDMRTILSERLKKITGSNIVLHTVVDESLIGGVLLKIGNKQVDGTVKSRLEGLKDEISAIIA